MYEERWYRNELDEKDWIDTRIRIKESDLLIRAPVAVGEEAVGLLKKIRRDLESYIDRDPDFSITHVSHVPFVNAPSIAHEMAHVTKQWGIGPMASVAGVIADAIGRRIGTIHGRAIVENGGDISIQSPFPLLFSLFPGNDSPFMKSLRFSVVNPPYSYGVCTSSGTIGHSYSDGMADALTVVALSAGEADAAATALGNMIQSPDDIERVIDSGRTHRGILGIIAVCGDRLGLWGNIDLQ